MLTPQDFLGPSFFGETSKKKDKHPRNEKEFKEYKKELKRIARWHEQVYKATLRGWKKSTPIRNVAVFLADEKSRET